MKSELMVSCTCVYMDNIKEYHKNMNKPWIKHQRANKSHRISAASVHLQHNLCLMPNIVIYSNM